MRWRHGRDREGIDPCQVQRPLRGHHGKGHQGRRRRRGRRRPRTAAGGSEWRGRSRVVRLLAQRGMRQEDDAHQRNGRAPQRHKLPRVLPVLQLLLSLGVQEALPHVYAHSCQRGAHSARLVAESLEQTQRGRVQRRGQCVQLAEGKRGGGCGRIRCGAPQPLHRVAQRGPQAAGPRAPQLLLTGRGVADHGDGRAEGRFRAPKEDQRRVSGRQVEDARQQQRPRGKRREGGARGQQRIQCWHVRPQRRQGPAAVRWQRGGGGGVFRQRGQQRRQPTQRWEGGRGGAPLLRLLARSGDEFRPQRRLRRHRGGRLRRVRRGCARRCRGRPLQVRAAAGRNSRPPLPVAAVPGPVSVPRSPGRGCVAFGHDPFPLPGRLRRSRRLPVIGTGPYGRPCGRALISAGHRTGTTDALSRQRRRRSPRRAHTPRRSGSVTHRGRRRRRRKRTPLLPPWQPIDAQPQLTGTGSKKRAHRHHRVAATDRSWRCEPGRAGTAKGRWWQHRCREKSIIDNV